MPEELQIPIGGEHHDLVMAEVAHARAALRDEFGVDHARLVLHGSAVSGRLRLVGEDPDPSDVDLIAIVEEQVFGHLVKLQREGAEIGQPRGSIKHLFVKIAGSGKLNPAEIDIYTQESLEQLLAGDPQSPDTQFVIKVMEDGVDVLAD